MPEMARKSLANWLQMDPGWLPNGSRSWTIWCLHSSYLHRLKDVASMDTSGDFWNSTIQFWDRENISALNPSVFCFCIQPAIRYLTLVLDHLKPIYIYKYTVYIHKQYILYLSAMAISTLNQYWPHLKHLSLLPRALGWAWRRHRSDRTVGEHPGKPGRLYNSYGKWPIYRWFIYDIQEQFEMDNEWQWAI